MKEDAKQLCLAMCELFGDALDRVTLWDKIAAALVAAAAKCDDGDTDRFAALCLDTIKADPAAAARNDLFVGWVHGVTVKDDAYRQAFVRYCGGKAAIVLVHARAAWERRKLTKGGAK